MRGSEGLTHDPVCIHTLRGDTPSQVAALLPQGLVL